jgi:hypothetical protein
MRKLKCHLFVWEFKKEIMEMSFIYLRFKVGGNEIDKRKHSFIYFSLKNPFFSFPSKLEGMK